MASKFSYEAWKRLVDAEILKKSGISANDLDDWRYADDFAEGLPPKKSAARAIKNAKGNSGF